MGIWMALAVMVAMVIYTLRGRSCRAARGQGAAGGGAGANLHSQPRCGLRRSLLECLHVLPRTRGHRRRKEGK